MPLDPVKETRTRGQIDRDAIEGLAYPDDDTGFSDRAVAVEFNGRRKQMMPRPTIADAETRPASLDELLKRATKPRHGDVAIRRECSPQLLPFALVAIDTPGLDQIRTGDLVGELFAGCIH